MIHGTVGPGFEAVRSAFADNFTHRGEVGAGIVVRHRGEVVVDLWGGHADPETKRPWEQDTPVVVFSATKGLVAMAYLVLAEAGEVSLDAPVADYWPAFGAHGKEGITIRMLLNHRAGLSVVDTPLSLPDFGDHPDRVHEALVAQAPLWTPDTRQAYGATVWGAYTAELFRQITGTTLGTWLAEHVFGPLGADVWLGMPLKINPRRARLLPAAGSTLIRQQLPTALFRRTAEGRLFRRVLFGRSSVAHRAFLNPTLGEARWEALNDPSILALELPWMNGVCSADGLCRVYAGLIGEVDGQRLVSPDAIVPLRRRQTWSDLDPVLQKPVGWSQGFLKEEEHLYSPNPASFGHSGAGGSVGWADPDDDLAFGYVMNQMDWRIRSPRAIALAQAVYACLPAGGST